MRGSLFTLLLVAVFAGILVRAVNIAYPSNPADLTVAVNDVLNATAPVVGQFVLLVGVGAVIAVTFARMSWAGGGF